MRLLAPLALLLFATGLSAQETRTAAPGEVSPPASVADMAWLVGQWQGTGVEGWAATENWLPPTGDTMVGTFIQADAGGNIMFSEHMYLAPQDGSLVLRVKHFSPDFTGWEEKDEMVNFRLLALEHCRATFSGLTIRCDGDDRLLIAVRMRQADGSTGELVFRFARAG